MAQPTCSHKFAPSLTTSAPTPSASSSRPRSSDASKASHANHCSDRCASRSGRWVDRAVRSISWCTVSPTTHTSGTGSPRISPALCPWVNCLCSWQAKRGATRWPRISRRCLLAWAEEWCIDAKGCTETACSTSGRRSFASFEQVRRLSVRVHHTRVWHQLCIRHRFAKSVGVMGVDGTCEWGTTCCMLVFARHL